MKVTCTALLTSIMYAAASCGWLVVCCIQATHIYYTNHLLNLYVFTFVASALNAIDGVCICAGCVLCKAENVELDMRVFNRMNFRIRVYKNATMALLAEIIYVLIFINGIVCIYYLNIGITDPAVLNLCYINSGFGMFFFCVSLFSYMGTAFSGNSGFPVRMTQAHNDAMTLQYCMNMIKPVLSKFIDEYMKKKATVEPGETCVICFGTSSKWVKLDCNHKFHTYCISLHIKVDIETQLENAFNEFRRFPKNPTSKCPICRHKVDMHINIPKIDQ